IPRLPTATPLRTEIYTTLVLPHFPWGFLGQFLTPPGGSCTLPPPLPPFHASRTRWFPNFVTARSPTRHRQRAAQSRGGCAHQGDARGGRLGRLYARGRGRAGALRGASRSDRARRGRPGVGGGAGRATQEEARGRQESARQQEKK